MNNYGSWKNWQLTQSVIFKPPKWVYLNKNYKNFLWNLTAKLQLFIISTFLVGWHFLKWVKKWLTLEMSSSLLLSCTNIVVITWLTNVNFVHNSKKILLKKFSSIWWLTYYSYKTRMFKYSRVALLEYIHLLYSFIYL